MDCDIQSFLLELGFDSLSDCGDYWRANAFWRGGNNRTAVSINKKNGSWKDFVSGEGGSLKNLIKTIKGKDFDLRIYSSKFGIDIEELSQHYEEPIIRSEKVWPSSFLNSLFPHYSFYENKGISADTLKYFKGGLAHDGPMNGRFVFPIFSQNGEIVGVSGRDMTDRWLKNGIKWKHMGQKKNWIYPVFVPSGFGSEMICFDAIKKESHVILVESIGDMLALWENGIKNTIVLFGLSISSKIISFLLSNGIKKITISTNNDSQKEFNVGKLAATKLFIDLMSHFDPEILEIALPPKPFKDFGEADSDSILKWKSFLGKKSRKIIYESCKEYLLEEISAMKSKNIQVPYSKRACLEAINLLLSQ